MLTADIFRPHDLPEEDAALWRAWCAATPEFHSPLLGPDFARLVAEVRDDARVAVFRQGGAAAGFLAFHKRPSGFARPIGSAFSDYHALVTAPHPRLDARQALAAAGISALRFGGLVDPYGLFSGSLAGSQTGYLLEMDPTPETYRQELRDSNPKRFRNWSRLHNKLEREVGEVSLHPGDLSRDAFDQLIEWKREQYRRTGSHDVYRPDWAKALLERVFEAREGKMRGMMSLLRADGKVVAGHFGPSLNRVWHGWISSIDPAHASRGPGFVLMLQVPEIMAALDLAIYDMAPSHEHYKAPFATRTLKVGEGLALATSGAGRKVQAVERVWALAGAQKVAAVGRLQRRLDHIAAAELSVGGRMRGVLEALAGYGRRNATRREPAAEPARPEA